MASTINASSTGAGGLISSGDASGVLQLQSNGTTALTATGANLSTTGSISSLNTFGFENRIINGGMVIDQRNAGAVVTPVDGQYTIDRFVSGMTQSAKYSVQQVTDAPTGFNFSLKVTSLSSFAVGAGDTFLISQHLEGFNTADLLFGTASAATVTLSFWVKSTLTGSFGGALENSAQNRAYPFGYTINSASTWEYKTVTITGDTTGTWVGATNGLGLRVRFGLGSGANFMATAGAWTGSDRVQPTGTVSVVATNGATWQVTGVQLEKGTQATSFDFRSIGQELALCQRYYEVFYADNAGEAGFSYTWSTGNRWIWHFKVQKRATSTFSLVGGGNWQVTTPSVAGGISSCGAYSGTGIYYLNSGANAIAGAASAEL